MSSALLTYANYRFSHDPAHTFTCMYYKHHIHIVCMNHVMRKPALSICINKDIDYSAFTSALSDQILYAFA